MFRFLKYKIVKIQICILSIIAFTLLFVPCWWLSFIFLACAVIISINEKVKRILSLQTSYAYGINQVRNVKCLVIGDLCTIDDEDDCVYIQTPGKSLWGSYWVLKRMFSIVDESRGKIIIVTRKKNVEKKELSLFEYHFLSNIYKEIYKDLGLEKRNNYPIIYSPVKAILLLLSLKSHNTVVEECPYAEIESFCKERGLNFEFRIIK